MPHILKLTENRFYYQYRPERLPCMTLTVHALLHVADTIETIGPVWAWWSFPIERQCGSFQRKIKSRKHLYTNLDNYLLQQAQLKQIKVIYNLSDTDLLTSKLPTRQKVELALQDECVSEGLVLNREVTLTSFSDQGIILHTWVGDKTNQTETMLHCIYPYLFTRYGLDTGTEEERKTFRALFPKEIEAWAKVTISNGDRIHASDYIKDILDRRDATFIRVRKTYHH